MLLITSRSEEKSSMARHSSLTAPVDTNWGKISSSPATFRKAPVSWNKAWLVCSGMREPSTRCKENWTLYQLLWLTNIICKCKDDIEKKGRSRCCDNISILICSWPCILVIINFRFQLNAQYFISITMLLYMFRATLPLSSGGPLYIYNIWFYVSLLLWPCSHGH